jgi:hypothetical protein
VEYLNVDTWQRWHISNLYVEGGKAMQNNLTPLGGALDMFRRGFKVFPLKPNEKTPALTGWQEWARNCSEKSIREHAEKYPSMNWGVALYLTEHSAVDIDCKNGAKGFESMLALAKADKGLLPTLTVKTPSGGKHLYYKGVAKNSASKVADGIDIRGQGGYLVAPGSVINGIAYEFDGDLPIADLPKWINEKSQENKLPCSAPALNSEMIISEGQRNVVLASLAGTMRRKGMNHESIEAALLTANRTQTDKPLPEDEVKRIAVSVSKYDPVEPPRIAATTPKREFALHCAATIVEAEIPVRKWIMEGRFVSGFLTGTFSRPGVGKSSLTMMEAVAVATGRNLTGNEVVEKGAVWIFNLEDPKEELERRLAAIGKEKSIPLSELTNVYYDTGRDTPLVMARETRQEVELDEELVQSLSTTIKKKNIRLLVVDPFVRSHGVEENNNVKIDKVLLQFQRVATETGCAINLVHHTTKEKDKEKPTGGPEDIDFARGASAFAGSLRIAHYLRHLPEGYTKKYGLDPSHDYILLTNPKTNLTKRKNEPQVFKHKEVTLLNGEGVGIVEPVLLMDQATARTQEQRETDRKRLTPVLLRAFAPDPLMPDSQPRTEIPVGEAMKLLLVDSVAAKVFESYQPRGRERHLRNLLSQPIEAEGKRISLEERAGKRTKFYLKLG